MLVKDAGEWTCPECPALGEMHTDLSEVPGPGGVWNWQRFFLCQEKLDWIESVLAWLSKEIQLRKGFSTWPIIHLREISPQSEMHNFQCRFIRNLWFVYYGWFPASSDEVNGDFESTDSWLSIINNWAAKSVPPCWMALCSQLDPVACRLFCF